MNIKEVKLFQVYFIWSGKRHRFHMQRNAKGEFYLTDKHALPAGLALPERQLADAILQEHDLS